MRTVVRGHPGARLLVAGRGDAAEVRELVGEDLRPHVALLGELSEADKAAFLRSVDVYCAPNLLGESFGVVLIEAMAAGAPIVASDLDAFARVLEDGAAGVLVPPRGRRALAGALCDLLGDPARRAELSAARRRVAAGYDWDGARPADPGRLRDGGPARRRRGDRRGRRRDARPVPAARRARAHPAGGRGR